MLATREASRWGDLVALLLAPPPKQPHPKATPPKPQTQTHTYTHTHRSRKALYSQTFNKKDSLTESFYVNMDTLFQLVDAELYSQLISLKDNSEYSYLDSKTYEEMYRDSRACVDLCHRDGVIKDEVARNPGKYVVKDPNMVPMLKQVRLLASTGPLPTLL